MNATRQPVTASLFVVREKGETTAADAIVSAYRWVAVAILLSLLWKAKYYPAALAAYREVPLLDAFFPALFRSGEVVIGLMVLPMILGVFAMVLPVKKVVMSHAIVTTVCMAGLCWHQGSYNDVTFLTCFWASLWCLCFAFSMGQTPETMLENMKRLALLIACLIFFGGAVGKWTPGYWSGEVLFHVYFVERDFWFFQLLRGWLDPEQLRAFATGYSRMVIIVETACAFLWLLPVRLGSLIAMLTFLGITVFSNFNLFSVMFCLLGLCWVGTMKRFEKN